MSFVEITPSAKTSGKSIVLSLKVILALGKFLVAQEERNTTKKKIIKCLFIV